MAASTEFPSELVTSRQIKLPTHPANNSDIPLTARVFEEDQTPRGDTVVQQYTIDLLISGRDDAEIVDSLEQYYTKLSQGFDEELARVQQETELHKAAGRELEAQEVTLPAFDQDDLANFFIECIYQERKSLRHQLLTLRQTEGKTVSTTFNTSLLNIYINTVKTGS